MKKLYAGLKLIAVLLLIVAAVGCITYLIKSSSDTEKDPTDNDIVVGYTVYFDPNGGSITGKETLQTDEHGKLTELSSKPSRDGFDFVCWSYDPELPYAISLDTVFYRDTVIYAYWVPIIEPDPTPDPAPSLDIYRITFDANGGELKGAASMLTNEDGQLRELPDEPTRDGYEFLGWSKGTTSFEKITTNTVFRYDVTVYAWWQELDPEPAIYTITFDPNGGELKGAATMQTNEYSKLTSLPSNPVRDGYYEFKGWSLDLMDFVKVTASTVFTSDTTVYAWWEVLEPDIYIITFNANGGELADTPQMDTNIDGKLSYLPTAPTYPAHEFKGWSKSASAYVPVTTNTVFSSNTTVYAWWLDLENIPNATYPKSLYSSNITYDGCLGYGGFANGNMLGNANKYLALDYAVFSNMAFSLNLYEFLENISNADLPAEVAGVVADWLCRYSELMSEFDVYEPDVYLAKVAELEAELLTYDIIMPISLSGGNYVESKIDFNSAIATDEVMTADMHKQLNALYNACEDKSEYKEQAKALLVANGYSLTDEITLAYTEDLTTWDIHNNPSANDLYILRNAYAKNMFDPNAPDEQGVIEWFEYNDDDRMSVTLHIREGVIWIGCQGQKIADFIADDFVAGVQHALDCGNRNGIVGVIEGAEEYYNGEITDFNDVGIHAWDDWTLELSFVRHITKTQLVYMLNTYSGYTPLSRSYYKLQGGKFGYEYDPTSEDYFYGVNDQCIAYTKYLCASFCDGIICFELLDKYFDYDNADIKTIRYTYCLAEDIPYDDTLSFRDLGTRDVKNNENAAVYGLGDYSLMLVFSGIYAEPDDGWDEQDRRTNDLLRLNAVRGMITSAIDRAQIISQFNGSLDGLASITNILSKPNSSAASEDEFTVDIAGTASTFGSGTLYEALVDMYANQTNSCGNPTTGSALYFDGWHNDTRAQECYDAAVAAAYSLGYELNADHPIYITLGIVGDGFGDNYASNVAWAIHAALQSVNVIVDIVFADSTADISEFDIALCYSRTPRELQF